MKRLFLLCAMLWYGVALSGATVAPEFRNHQHENRSFFKHRPKADLGKHFFSMPEEMSSKKLSRMALILGILSMVLIGIGGVIYFTTFTLNMFPLFIVGALLGFCVIFISIKILGENDVNPKDVLRTTVGLVGVILGLALIMLTLISPLWVSL